MSPSRPAPGAAPLAQLDAALASVRPAPRASTSGRRGGESRPVLVVDQFEELFTLCPDEDASGSPSSTACWPCPATHRVVLTMRADFWGECAPYPALREAMQAHQELIAPMDEAELRRRWSSRRRVGPGGLRFEADLRGTILEDVQGEPGAMPLLQHALLELWKRRNGRWLPRPRSTAPSGGCSEAIAHTADDLCDRRPGRPTRRACGTSSSASPAWTTDGARRRRARRDTRRRVALDELVPAGGDPAPDAGPGGAPGGRPPGGDRAGTQVSSTGRRWRWRTRP